MEFPAVYGARPPWHDVQAAIQGPAISDIELLPLAVVRQHHFRRIKPLAYVSRSRLPRRKIFGRDLPEQLPDPQPAGNHAVQVLRTYPARLRRYPFAPLGERSIANAYRKVFDRARRLIYIEDQYLWAPFVADLLADALRKNPDLHLIALVPRYPDKEGASELPSLVGREQAIKVCRLAGHERFAIYDVENHAGCPVYVHAKVVVIDGTRRDRRDRGRRDGCARTSPSGCPGCIVLGRCRCITRFMTPTAVPFATVSATDLRQEA